jgi:hypothetical protein
MGPIVTIESAREMRCCKRYREKHLEFAGFLWDTVPKNIEVQTPDSGQASPILDRTSPVFSRQALQIRNLANATLV